MEYFSLKLGQDLENRAAHLYQTFRGVPPPPPRVLRVDGWGAPLFSSLFSDQNVIFQYSFQTCFLETIAVSVNQSNVHTKLVKAFTPMYWRPKRLSTKTAHTFLAYTGKLCISQFQQCPSPPPGNSGAFSRTFHPGGRALAFHPITPGHLTIPHSFTSHHCRLF